MLDTVVAQKTCSSSSQGAWAWIGHKQANTTQTAAAVRRSGRRGASTCYAQPCRDIQDTKQGLPNPDKGLHSRFAFSPGQADVPAAGGSSHSALRNTLPDPLLFSNIKACDSWVDCQRLLAANAEQLDAMLLSTLVTQTVYVSQGATQQRKTAANLQPQHQEAVVAVGDLQQHHKQRISTVLAPSSSRSSRSNAGGSKAAYNHYLQQLAQVSLLLISTFRPQQFSNVLWGLAKCKFKASPVFIDKYLAQAELQLVNFPPRNLAQLIWALAALQARPCRSFLSSFLAETFDKLAHFKPIDIANTLWGLAVLGVKPPIDWLQHVLDVAERQWVHFKPQELSITVWGLAKLGLGFRGQPACPRFSHGGGGLSPEGLDGLLTAVAWKLPDMSPQEITNLLWGLATGRADLAAQQVQFVAEGALRVLYKHQLSSSSSSSSGTSSSSSSSSSDASSSSTGRDLCTCTWALTRLNWTPSLQQAKCLLYLLQNHLPAPQQQQQWTHSSSSSSDFTNSRLAATFLLCFSRLRIRPPEDIINKLLLLLQQGSAQQTTSAADLVQGLAGCRGLSWRPSKTWWLGFYRESLGVLQDASLVELSRILTYMASLKPTKAHSSWWIPFWQLVGCYTDGAFAACGLKQRNGLAVVPGRAVSSSDGSSGDDAASAALSLSTRSRGSIPVAAAAAGDANGFAVAGGRRLRVKATTCASSSSTAEAAAAAGEETLAQQQQEESLLADSQQPWLEIHQSMQQLTRLRTAAQQQRLSACDGDSVTDCQLVNPQSTLMLLWACVKVNRLPVKKVLWQLLVLVLVDLHCYTAQQLTVVMCLIAMMITQKGANRVQCHRVLKLLVVGAQWRLHTGLAGDGSVERRFAAILQFLAAKVGVQRLLMLDYRSGVRRD